MQIVQTTPQTAHTLAYSNQSKPDAAHLRQEEIFMMSGDIWVEMKGVCLFILVPWKDGACRESQNNVLTFWHELVIPETLSNIHEGIY